MMNNNNLNLVFDYASSNYSTLERDCNYAINNYLKHQPQPWFTDEDRREIFGDFRLKLLTSAGSFNPEKNTSIRTWSKFVALSSIVDYMRKHKDFLPIFLKDKDGEEYEIDALSSRYTCEDEVIGWEASESFEGYLMSRSELEGQLLVLSASGYSVKELSELFSIPSTKISSILFRMRQDFKNKYNNAA